MESSTSPAIPTGIGGLLAEEWTVDPYSFLPSMLEMMMMQDVQQSTRKALDSALDVVLRTLRRQSQQTYLETSVESSSNTWRRAFFQRIQELRVRLTRSLASQFARYRLEFQTLVMYLLERQCLHSTSATLAESVYGTRRSKLERNTGKLLPLTNVDRTRLALFLVLAPYLRDKLKRILEKNASQSLSTVFPWLQATLDSTNLWCQLRFLLGQSLFFDLPSLLLGQVVRRVTQQDSVKTETTETQQQKDTSRTAAESTQPTQGAVKISSDALKWPALCLVSAGILLSCMTLWRSEWQQQRRDRVLEESQSGAKGQIMPPPPLVKGIANTQCRSDQCPICQRKRVNPCASPSGFVFCLACLLPYVRKHGTCPLSDAPCSEAQIVRLYEPQMETHTSNNNVDAPTRS